MADDWFCTSQTSRRVGDDTIEVCGVAQAPEEAKARDLALDAAKTEFKKLCDSSDDCRGRRTSLEPMRNECLQVVGHIECRRMVRFSIGEPRGFANTYESNSLPKVKIETGMRKERLLVQFGIPSETLDAGNGFLIFSYVDRPFCLMHRCAVVLKGDVVDHFSDFKPEFTNAFDGPKLQEPKSFWQKIKDLFAVNVHEY